MKFATSHVIVIAIDSGSDVNTDAKAFSLIDKMYEIAYSSRAGVKLSAKGGLTPNEERLTALLQERFGKYGSHSPVIVDCGSSQFLYARENDEYSHCVDLPFHESLDEICYHRILV